MLPQMEFHKRNKVNMQDINLHIEDSDRYIDQDEAHPKQESYHIYNIVKRRYSHKPCIWVKNEREAFTQTRKVWAWALTWPLWPTLAKNLSLLIVKITTYNAIGVHSSIPWEARQQGIKFAFHFSFLLAVCTIASTY